MMATIRKDRTIEFGQAGGLLSMETITRQAFNLLEKNARLPKEFDDNRRIEELRKSCGISPPKSTIRIKLPRDFHGKARDEGAEGAS